MLTAWVIIIILILLSAFFSGAEMAFVSSNKFKVEIDKNQDNLRGKLLTWVTEHPSRFIGTMLIGNNIVLVIYGITIAKLIEDPIRDIFIQTIQWDSEAGVILTQTILSTILILITGEFIPKALFNINPNQSLNLFLLPVSFFYFLLYPLVSFTIWLSKFFLKYVFRVPLKEEEVTFEKTDLNYYLQQISEEDSHQKEELENEVKILQNVLEFPTVRAKECMIPRTEIVAIEIHASIDDLKKIFIETGHSKIMVYRDTIDEIIGFVHSFNIFKNPLQIQSIMMPIMIVPETMLIKDILTQFIQQHKSVSVVVDEYGGTSGIITTEDIIEEIFGDIEDEHDVEIHTEKKVSNEEYIFSGRLEIDYINDTYKLNLPEREEYTTLAGLILFYEKDLPKSGHLIEIEGFKFVINKVSNTRIEEVGIHILKS